MDYLGGILTKALGLGPVAERRRPSRFENPTMVPVDDFSSLEQDVEIESPAPRKPRLAPQIQDVTGEPEMTPKAVSGSHDPLPEQPAVPKPHRQSPVRPVTGTPDRVEPRAEKPAESGELTPVRTHETVERIRERVGERVVESVVERESVVRERIERQTQSRTEINSKTLLEAQRWDRPAPSTARQELTARQEPSGAQPARADSPDIHISIGRIEVRASVAASAPTPKARVKEPQMGLDEYLKSRRGGSR